MPNSATPAAEAITKLRINPNYRYVRWVYTTKPAAGNVSLENIRVTKSAYVYTGVYGSSWNTLANWIGGMLPQDGANVTLSGGSLVLDQNIAVHDMAIRAGTKLTLNSAKTLSVGGNFTIYSDVTGTGTFVNNGILVVSGITRVQQYLSSGRNWYISIPVTGATSGIITSSGGSLWKYNENEVSPGWDAITNTTTSLDAVKGYVAKTLSDGVITFTGILNTGLQSRTGMTRGSTGAKRGFYLLGNPYPSFVDWALAIKNNLEPTLWYRTKSTAGSYVSDTYNATANVGTNNNGSGTVTQYIAPMQSFWVRVNNDNITNGAISFDNSMCSVEDGSLHTNKLRSGSIDDGKIIRIRISNKSNSDEAIVLFHQDACDGYDVYDSPKMSNDNPSIPEIFTVAGTDPVVINGLNIDAIRYPLMLGLKVGQADSLKIKVTELSNFGPDERVLLIDNQSKITQDLTNGTTYAFNSEITKSTDRFSLVFSSVVSSGVDKFLDSKVLIYVNKNGFIAVKNDCNQEGVIAISNVLGQIIMSNKISGDYIVSDKKLKKGVYFVTVFIERRKTTQKVIIE